MAPTLHDGLPICGECKTTRDCVRDNFCFRRENAKRQGAAYDWPARVRHLLCTAIDAEDVATVEAARLHAAGRSYKLVFTSRNGLAFTVRCEEA